MRKTIVIRLCLFVILSALFLLPVSGAAAEEIVLSSFEEMKKVCSEPSVLTTGSLLCVTENFVFAEDFEIPSGAVIIFRNFTVPEGVTLSIMECAEIRTYGLTVQGNLINRGKVIQQDLAATWAGEEIEVSARIPGHVENKGEMVLTDVFGKRNINRFGGKLIMYETASYQDKLRIAIGENAPTPAIEVVDTPMPTPAVRERSRAMEIMDLLEEILPKLSFFLVLVCLFVAVKVGITSSREEKRKEQRTAFTDVPSAVGFKSAVNMIPEGTYGFSAEDHFQRDRRNRIEQLDEWLKNGLIDRKEYLELKRRYREDP